MFDKNTKKIILLSAIITFNIFLLIFIFFNISTLSKYNKSKYQLNTYIKNINIINSQTGSINEGQTIDIEKAKDKLPSVINSLIKINKNLENYDADSRYKYTFDSLKSGLDNNILMYKQLLSIFNNLESNDINNSIQNFINYKNNCIKYYGYIKSNHKFFSLSKDSTVFINNSYNYILNFTRIKNDKDILNTQNMEFENNINDILAKFNSVRVNLYYYAESARKNSISYDNAIVKVQNNKDKFNNILEQFSQINVPQNQIEVYRNFNKVLNDYNTYINSFSSALKKEKYISESKNSSLDISDLYKDSDTKYNIMNKNFNNLKNNFKDVFY